LPPAADRREGDSAVPADEATPAPEPVRGKDRMERFSGDVDGFAATRLVPDLAVHPPGTPPELVLHAWR
jgi:hypothetical protein